MVNQTALQNMQRYSAYQNIPSESHERQNKTNVFNGQKLDVDASTPRACDYNVHRNKLRYYYNCVFTIKTRTRTELGPSLAQRIGDHR